MARRHQYPTATGFCTGIDCRLDSRCIIGLPITYGPEIQDVEHMARLLLPSAGSQQQTTENENNILDIHIVNLMFKGQ